MATPIHVILSRDPKADGRRRLFEDALRSGVVRRAAAGLWTVADALDLPEDDPLWVRWRDLGARLIVLTWQNPRPVRWLFARHGIDVDPADIVDLRTLGRPDDLLERLPAATPDAHEIDWRDLVSQTPERWFPVVDYDRCVHCTQCLQYCLFGVYDTDDDGRLRVANPDNCKPGCPACSRICPRGAIMFPRCPDPAIAGAEGAELPPPADAETMKRHRDRYVQPSAEQADTSNGHAASNSQKQPPESDDLDTLIDDLERLT